MFGGDAMASLRQRMYAILSRELADAVPWTADLQWWRGGLAAQGSLPRRYRGVEGLLRLHQEQSTGIYLDGLYMCGAAPMRGSVEVLDTFEDDSCVQTIRTRYGDLRTVRRRATDSWAIVEHPVSTVGDLRSVRAYYDSLEYELNSFEYIRRVPLYDGWGIPMPLVQRTPLMEMVITWCGIQRFTYLEADHEEEVRSTLEAISYSQDRLYRELQVCPSPYLEIGDNISGEVVGGYFRKYGSEYYERRVAELHSAGKKVGTHIDGTLKPVLRLVAETGVDFVEGITPAPVGDLSPAQIAAELAGLDTIVWGGVPAALFVEPDWQMVRAYVADALGHLWRDGRLILGVGDQVPPNGHIGYCQCISELVDELGPPSRW